MLGIVFFIGFVILFIVYVWWNVRSAMKVGREAKQLQLNKRVVQKQLLNHLQIVSASCCFFPQVQW